MITCSMSQGIGTDTNSITRDFALTFHVVDFNLTALAPGSVTVNQSSVSGPIAFQVTAAGSFSGTVAPGLCRPAHWGHLQVPAFQFSESDFWQPCGGDSDRKHRREHTDRDFFDYDQRHYGRRSDQDAKPLAHSQRRQHQQSGFHSGYQQSISDLKPERTCDIQRHRNSLGRLQQHGKPELCGRRADRMHRLSAKADPNH